MRWIAILVFAVALALAPSPAWAQWERPGDDDPAIAATRQQVNDAPFDEKAIHSEVLLKLIATKFGSDSAEYATELQLHATNLNFAGRSAEALQTMKRVVALITKIHGTDSTDAAFANRDYATALSLNGFKAEAVEPRRQFITTMTKVAYACGKVEPNIIRGCSHDEKDLGTFLLGYGQLLHDLGRTDEGIAAFEETIERFTPRWEGCESEEWGTKCDRAAHNRRAFMGEYARFLELAGRQDRALAILKENAVPRLDALAGCAAEQCEAEYWLVSDYRSYRELLSRTDPAAALALDARWLPVLASAPVFERGAVEGADYFDAEYREAVDALLADYAEKASGAGKAAQALAVLEPLGRGDLVEEQAQSADFEAQLAAINTQIEALGYSESNEKAKLLEDKAAVIAEQKGALSDAYGEALREVAHEMRDTDTPARAEEYYRRSLAVFREGFGDDNFRTLYAVGYLSDHLVREGKPEAAIAALEEVLADPGNDKSAIYADPVQSRLLASGFMDQDEQLNTLRADLADLLLTSGSDPALALASARHAAIGRRAYRNALGFDRSDESRLEFAQSDPFSFIGERRYREYFQLYADALWDDPGRSQTSAEAAFDALQEASIGTTSRAVAKAASERAANRGGVSALLEERKTIDANNQVLENMLYGGDPGTSPSLQQRQDLENFILSKKEELGLPDTPGAGWNFQQLDTVSRGKIRDDIARNDFRRAEIDQEIARAAPGYFELVRPKALDLADAQALLAPDEAFLLVVPTPRGTHSLLLTRNSLDWVRSDMDEDQLNRHVRRLLWDVGANIKVSEAEESKWLLEGQGRFPFDRETAHLLNRELVAPFESQLNDKSHLFVAAAGSLSSLPFAIFVTEPPVGRDGEPDVLRATPWLGDKIALVQLPSLQSLQLLRAVDAERTDNMASLLLGFGNPELAGEAAPRGISANNRSARAVGLPVGSGWNSDSNGGLADPEVLRKLARLPGTETELLAMKQVFGDTRTRLYLGGEATEANLKAADLEHASVLFLATHGLVAGELDGLAEPGLVLTPPSAASNLDDGLLSASEVTALKMKADWVILSACNTASGDGSDGAPGLSGLARSFFYAGAQSLLATHWPVRDDVASVMTVRLFGLRTANPSLSRAEALQAAMREIRNNQAKDGDFDTWAHPSAWAPFAYIGDVAR